MTEHSTEQDLRLDSFFDAVRREPPMPGGDFMARILVDGESAQADFAPRPAQSENRGMLASLSALFGGFVGVGGMATAALAGVWIGFAGLGNIDSYWPLGVEEISLSSVDLMPGESILSLALEGE